MAEASLPVTPCRKCGASERFPSGRCKPCQDIAVRKWRSSKRVERKPFNYDELRACRKCGELFSGKSCGHCKNAARKVRRAALRKKIVAYLAIYLALHAEEERAMAAARREVRLARTRVLAAAWRSRNKEKTKKRAAIYRLKNLEKVNERVAAWCAKHPEANRVRFQNRRARLQNNGGKLSRDIAAKLFKLQRGMCACCGKPLGDDYHMDHRMPLAKGGKNEDSNIQLLTAKCNFEKNARDPIEFMQSRGFLL